VLQGKHQPLTPDQPNTHPTHPPHPQGMLRLSVDDCNDVYTMLGSKVFNQSTVMAEEAGWRDSLYSERWMVVVLVVVVVVVVWG